MHNERMYLLPMYRDYNISSKACFFLSGIQFSGQKSQTFDILPHYLKNYFVCPQTTIPFQDKWEV